MKTALTIASLAVIGMGIYFFRKKHRYSLRLCREGDEIEKALVA